tara:strand:- start:1887 stop:2066 length:180 start_codon:yes stop_codon:yes gene_type:complete
MKQELIDAIESIATEINDSNRTIDINFDTDTYNLIASIYEEIERGATALERIATALENK